MNLIANNFLKMRNNVEIVNRVKSYLYYRTLSIVITYDIDICLKENRITSLQ